jgi:PAS domain S-box-containing protein
MDVPAYQSGHLGGLQVRLTGDRLAVCRLDAHAGVPAWATDAPGFMTFSRTGDEVSVVCAESAVPAGVRLEGSFRLLQVAGPIPFEVVGLIAGVATILSTAGVSVFPIATFDTDYLLIRDADAERSVEALRRAGCEVECTDLLAGPGTTPPLPSDGRWNESAVLNRLTASTRVGVLLSTPTGEIRDANDALLELLGCTRDDIASGGYDLRSLTASGYEEADRVALAELRLRRMATPYEKEFLHRSGRRVPAIVTGASYGRAEEPLILWVVIDLAERRRAERALRESERRFRLLADAAPVLVWTAGSDEQRSFVNRRWLTFTGRALEDELGWGWLEALHPDDRGRARRTYEAAFAGKQAFRIEYRLRRHDGQYRWVIDDGAPLDDERGLSLGFVGACVDVTGRRQAEELREQLLVHERRARSEAERVSRLKDDFLGTLSHELRTPLNAILGWTQVLRRSQSTSITPAGLDVIDRNARALTHLVDDLLDVSRLVAGDVRLSIDTVHLRPVVEAAIASVRPAADARGVTIEEEVADSLPPLRADASRLQQIAWNLLSNAIKFTPSGGRVWIVASEEPGGFRLEVSDTGRGIAPEYLPQVFDRFSQADSSASRMHGGLGLGLAIVRQLVELHGGTVEVESDGPGRGARFTVHLPVREHAQARGA